MSAISDRQLWELGTEPWEGFSEVGMCWSRDQPDGEKDSRGVEELAPSRNWNLPEWFRALGVYGEIGKY